ncbi:MAG: sulfite exporter TauE/SafE family protein [Planctomycetes bacterium]|nr:sulfite exporter TauE/SafE family protein [Planctomycetota bacterium]
MTSISNSLAAASVTIGFLHTLLGPDHYLPFVAMARAGNWSQTKTIVITVLCGIGHVLSSVVIGFVGIGLGVGLDRMEGIESARSNLAGWALIAFGLAYLIWGIRAAVRNQPHSHLHAHSDGIVHIHEHDHEGLHLHAHESPVQPPSLTPWILFTIFLFGPCEALIPMLMVPAAAGSMWDVVVVTLLFGVTTIATMTVIVLVLLRGAQVVRIQAMQRYNHAAAGAVLFMCGLAIRFGL